MVNDTEAVPMEMVTAALLEALTDELKPAWPNGVPLEELAFVLRLTPDRRASTVCRLQAMIEADGGNRDWRSVARQAGLSRSQYYDVRRRWLASRSLASIAPYQPRPRSGDETERLAEPTADTEPADGGVSTADERKKAASFERRAVERAAIAAAVEADPVSRNATIAMMVRRDTGTTLDQRTLIGMVQRERRLLSLRPGHIHRTFGRAILADVSAIDLALDVDGRREVAVLAIVADEGSSLILGHAIGRAEQAADLQVEAARRAIDRLAESAIDLSTTKEVRMSIVVGASPAQAAAELTARAVQVLGEGSVDASNALRFGYRAAALIGQIGRFRFRPRATTNSAFEAATVPGPAITVDKADALLGSEIRRHDAHAWAALMGSRSNDETIAAGRGAVADMIGKVFAV